MSNAKRCCGGDTCLVIACSGASSVGQLTNEVAKRLATEADANFFCLAGVGGHVAGMVLSVRRAEKILVLDGCVVGCGKKCLEEAGVTTFDHLYLTDLGIEKKPGLEADTADLEMTLAAVRETLRRPATS